MLRNTSTHFGAVAKFLHWLLFLLITGLLISGLVAEDLGEELEDVVFGLHKAIGVVVLVLVPLRWGWRLSGVNPASPANSAAWEIMLARLTHFGLYLLMLLQPLTGFLMVQLEGHPINFFGLFEMPMLFAKDKALGHWFGEAHEIGWFALAALIGLHAAAVLYHHFIRKDDVLRRMTRG